MDIHKKYKYALVLMLLLALTVKPTAMAGDWSLLIGTGETYEGDPLLRAGLRVNQELFDVGAATLVGTARFDGVLSGDEVYQSADIFGGLALDYEWLQVGAMLGTDDQSVLTAVRTWHPHGNVSIDAGIEHGRYGLGWRLGAGLHVSKHWALVGEYQNNDVASQNFGLRGDW